MSIILPDQTEANTETTANNNATIAAAQATFIASTTVLINQAIANGFFWVQPVLIPNVTSAFVTTYFQDLGYTVLFPIVPIYPYNPAFVPGFPEVLPPGYEQPYYNPYNGTEAGPPRIQISWGPVPQFPFPWPLPPIDW